MVLSFPYFLLLFVQVISRPVIPHYQTIIRVKPFDRLCCEIIMALKKSFTAAIKFYRIKHNVKEFCIINL